MTTADECLPYGLADMYDRTRNVKTAHVEEWRGMHQQDDPDSEPDMTPVAHLSYDQEHVEVMLISPVFDRTTLLWATHQAAGAVRPAAITLIADAKVATGLINPDTGQEWVPGELAESEKNTDCMVWATTWANGRSRMVMQTYIADKATGLITWGDPVITDTGNDPENERVEGAVHDDIARILNCDCGAEIARLGEEAGFDRSRQLSLILSIMLPEFQRRGFLCLVGTDDDQIGLALASEFPDSATGPNSNSE